MVQLLTDKWGKKQVVHVKHDVNHIIFMSNHAFLENHDETEANTRQEKKIDPLVVDVERKPIDENTDGEPIDPSEQEVEGRFFLKDKLCALGLADVSS